LIRNKAPANVTSTIDNLPTDAVNVPNNINEEMCDEVAAETKLKVVHEIKTE
jgi:hypothetical protein